MGRGCGLFLLAVGVLACVVGGIGVVIGVTELQRGGAGLLAVFGVVVSIGVVSLIVAVALLRQTKPWTGPTGGEGTDLYPANKPQSRDLDGTPYTVVYTPPVKGKHARPSTLTFSAPLPAPGEFEMVVETPFDRLCKRWGLAVEVQTGDAKFDDECYVRSDTPAFAEAYLSDPLKRTAILDLRRFGFLSITLKNGTLSTVRTGFDPVADSSPDFDADIAARLVLLSRDLPADRPEFAERTGGSRKTAEAVLWVLLIGFALTALSLFTYTPVHVTDLLIRALAVLLAWPVFVLVSAKLLSGTSRSHLAWARVVAGSLILFPIGSGGVIGLLNGVLDGSPDAVHNATIVEKYTSKSKNTTKYHVRVASWRQNGDTISYQISSGEYNAVVPNKSRLVVTTRAGGLGVEWLKSKWVDANPKP